MDEAYSQIAWGQLDEIEVRDPETYDAVCETVEAVFADPGLVRANSAVISTPAGPRFKTLVSGRYPLAVFWSDAPAAGPRIEAVFPHETSAR